VKRIVPLFASLAVPVAANAQPVLSPVWQNHVVIQQDKPVVVEGWTESGAAVNGTLGGDNARATADADGSFSLTFRPRTASADPIVLAVADASGSTQVTDIVVGDVWLCSGQSNMAWSIGASLRGNLIAQGSEDPLLRMLFVPLETAAAPMRDFAGEVSWQSASPETTGSFSAACYFMLRDLRAATEVPQGAVHSSWGGSQIRAWLTPEGGTALYGAEQMALLDGFASDPLAAVTEFAPVWEDWWREATGREPWSDMSAMDWQPVPEIAPWTSWEEGPVEIGNVWFRRRLDLTSEQIAGGGVLNIGVIDDLDATWVNGHAVGFTHGWSNERQYTVPREFLQEGTNEIVFAASNSYAGGGMQSEAERLSFTPEGGPAISLAEGWLYADGGVSEMPPRAPWDANAGIGVMHNRMIAPIGNFAMKGAAWYQGESDVGIPGYADRLRELFAGWRRQMGADMQMLVIQLPNYGDTASEPVESGWAQIRADELAAVAADANAALIPTLDVGEAADLHPPDKTAIGQRLALAAQGIALPMPQRASLQADIITVTFSGVEGGLRALSGAYPLGVELCGERQESCRFVLAQANGNTLRIWSDGQPATRVRYAWVDAPVVNLFDGRGIAVPGFELPIE